MNLLIDFAKHVVRKNPIGNFLIREVLIRGWDEKLYVGKVKRQYKKDTENPTAEMLEQREFFKANKERIENCIGYLEDQESRDCYISAIKYRCSHDKKDAPRYTKERYFISSIFGTEFDDEIFVDGGAFVGDTVRQFYRLSKGKYKKIIAFEPDTENFKMLDKLKYPRVIKYNIGLWNLRTELKFFNNGSCGSKVVEKDNENVVKIKTDMLDDIPDCQDATLIKLDVEGAEMKALKGAEKIIRKNHPKLTICLYHSCEDMIDIIEYIHDMFPNYRMYVRHHSYSTGETILYCV